MLCSAHAAFVLGFSMEFCWTESDLTQKGTEAPCRGRPCSGDATQTASDASILAIRLLELPACWMAAPDWPAMVQAAPAAEDGQRIAAIQPGPDRPLCHPGPPPEHCARERAAAAEAPQGAPPTHTHPPTHAPTCLSVCLSVNFRGICVIDCAARPFMAIVVYPHRCEPSSMSSPWRPTLDSSLGNQSRNPCRLVRL